MSGSAEAFPLPLTPEGVTASWLTAALRTRYPDVEVHAVDVLERVEGTATKLRLRLDVTGADLPEVLWIKAGLAEHREMIGPSGIYEGEVFFFNEVAPAFDLPVPRSYLGLSQPDPVQGVVLLEDLADHRFSRATRPMTLDEAASGLDALAALHGQSWGDERVARAPLVMGPRSEAVWTAWFDAIDDYFAAARAFAGPTYLHDAARLRKAFAAYRRGAQAGTPCLLHGDSHIGNTYVASNGKIGFVDWQTISHGRWVHDVSYFLVSALDIPDRRRHWDDLLQHYLDALARYPRTEVPALADVEAELRAAAVYGLLCWLCNPNIWQPEDVNTATYARFAAAADDFGTYALLGA